MEITRQEVLHIAGLSRLSLNESEVEGYRKSLSAVLSYMEKLNQADTSSVSEAVHVMSVPPLLRADVILPSLSVDDALQNAPSKEDGFVLVPKVL